MKIVYYALLAGMLASAPCSASETNAPQKEMILKEDISKKVVNFYTGFVMGLRDKTKEPYQAWDAVKKEMERNLKLKILAKDFGLYEIFEKEKNPFKKTVWKESESSVLDEILDELTVPQDK
jgi:hypothetical protein